LLAVLGVVLELLIVEKYLLARCENKLRAAVHTLQNSITEFHGRLPFTGSYPEIGHGLQALPVPVPCSFVFPYNKGPVRPKIRAAKILSGSPERPAKRARLRVRSKLLRQLRCLGNSNEGAGWFFTWAGHAASHTTIDRTWRNAKANKTNAPRTLILDGTSGGIAHWTNAAWVALFAEG
jgi:hypothetical protein